MLSMGITKCLGVIVKSQGTYATVVYSCTLISTSVTWAARSKDSSAV